MAQTIRHVVVLMLENRSFDHVLGFMKDRDYDIDGLTGDETNPVDPEGTRLVHATPDAPFKMAADAGHSLKDTNLQLFLQESGPPPVGLPNRGFIISYARQGGVAPETAPSIMQCFAPGSLPVITTLAREFAVCDGWFSSVPGPTWPNRFFAHAATSKGEITNNFFANYDMPTIFEHLFDEGHSWKIYTHADFPQAQLLTHLLADEFIDNWDSIGGFKRDAAAGTLPNYSFIEPMYSGFFGRQNDQHPPSDMRPGEQLIANVYNAVRNSPQWQQSLLVIVYDEHGGTYDHVLPPANCKAATPPDGRTHRFDFARLGVRVPIVLVSPFIEARTIVRTRFDHSSVPATLKRLFGLKSFLTHRDENANTFEDIPRLSAPRTDTPDRLGARETAPVDDWGDEVGSHERMARAAAAGTIPETPPSEFLVSMVEGARRLPFDEEDRRIVELDGARRIVTEYDAALYLRQAATRFRNRQARRKARRDANR